ncbi:hypothetical protein FHK02_5087 [Spirosoma sp. LMG 31448]|uniref:BLUF domain-containing protein n=1 Tax=Spirosoma utsteinense TaxID=2585773 RepID=A0ABR6WDE0_9BACT|nr:hypothetical protein [Spirosoma utsteinense]MBC3794579.1 hypothetical protein [Spirosoma utsteinense]
MSGEVLCRCWKTRLKSSVRCVIEIEADPRHTNLTRIFVCPVIQRLFSTWSIDYETTTDQHLDTIQILVDLDQVDSPIRPTHQLIILKLIWAFYQSDHFN